MREKILIPTELNKKPNGVLTTLNEAVIGKTHKERASTITARYYKGVGGGFR